MPKDEKKLWNLGTFCSFFIANFAFYKYLKIIHKKFVEIAEIVET